MMDPVKKQVYSEIVIGDVTVRYLLDEEGRMGLSLVPSVSLPLVVEDEYKRIDPLVQLKAAGDAYSTGHSNGRTMRNSATVRHGLVFDSQKVATENEETVVTTILRDPRGLTAVHRLTGRPGEAFVVEVSLTNSASEPVLLEMAESCNISDITPFEASPANDRLKIFRMRGEWADEGNLEVFTPYDLKIEPRPKKFDALTARIGHRGTNTCIEYVPFYAVEDTKEGVLWGVMLSHASSWQMEIYRRGNGIAIGGGIADADNGAWTKEIRPGETFHCPAGFVSTAKGELQDLTDRFLSLFERRWEPAIPEIDRDLPIQYNEYRSTIGKPTAESVLRQAQALSGRGFTYFVIDAGWYNDDSGKWYEFSGDWIPNEKRFPGGLKPVTEKLREMGFVPGIWFEPETCGIRSEAFGKEELLVRKYGKPLTSGWRRFIDVRTEKGRHYLDERITKLLKDNDFGYVKLDSNETLGTGCDGTEAFGEELRKYVLALEDFYRSISEKIPGIVIENVAAGSARAVDAFTGITSMTSFSDAFEHRNNPVVAANMQRLLPARAILIWCVADKNYDEQGARYFYASGTLGRMCVSGDVASLSEEQNALLDEAVAFYKAVTPVIAKGKSRRYGPDIESTDAPKGWQAVVRTGTDGRKLVTVHTFENAPDTLHIPLGKEGLSIEKAFIQKDRARAEISDTELTLAGLTDFEGMAFLLYNTEEKHG